MTPAKQPAAGDIVVIGVARHFDIGRVQTAGTVLSAVAVANHLDEAIAYATVAATGHQRVFLCEHADFRDCVEIDVRPLIDIGDPSA